MSQRSLFWPLSLIAAFALLVVMLLFGALPSVLVAQTDQCAESYPTPGPVRESCYTTATARVANNAKTNTASAKTAYPPPTTPPQNIAPPAPTAAPAQEATATLTPTNTVRPATATLGPTRTPTATRQVAQGTPTSTATSVLAGLETILCVPGTTVTITGEASPGLVILAYFNARPVGGALTRRDGTYRMLLNIGDERPGVYAVELRERLSRALVRELACEVPSATPTPTWPLVP